MLRKMDAMRMEHRPDFLYNVGFFQAPSGRDILPVRIPEGCEIVELITGGKVFFEVDGAIRTFGRGTIFWHESGEYTVCKTPADDPYRCLAIRFGVPSRSRAVPRISTWHDDGELDEFVDEAMRRFHDETVDKGLLRDYLFGRLVWAAYLSGRRREAGLYPPVLVKVLNMLQEPGALLLPVRVLAQKAGVSEPYLYALFHQYLHSSPHKYLLNCRLRSARIRLAGSDDNIKTIAEECGFENIESFYRAFRRNSGMPPGEYRRRQRPNREFEESVEP